MEFLDKLYSSNYFGIGLFAVISFLVVTFLIVLFFGKKDEKKRKLEATQKLNTENTFKETTKAASIEIPVNPEPVAPIKLEQTPDVKPVGMVEQPVDSLIDSIATPLTSVTPVMPIPPVAPVNSEKNNEFLDNLVVDEPKSVSNQVSRVEPVIAPVTPIITEEPKINVAPKIELEPTKIEIPKESVKPIINEEIKPIIKEEEPKLQINEEPVINTYYNPAEKQVETESIKVPNIDFDSLAKSISKELDELENNSRKYDEIKVTPLHDITKHEEDKQPETFSSVYVREPIKEIPKVEIELPKKIDLPARKSE